MVKLMGIFIDGGLASICRLANQDHAFDLDNEANRESKVYEHERWFNLHLQSFITLSDIRLYLHGKATLSISSLDDFERRVKEFGYALMIYHQQTIQYGWYLHLLVSHLPSILRKHGSIYRFSMSPLERKNGIHSRMCSSSVLLTKSSFDLMKKELRLLMLFLMDIKAIRKKYSTSRKSVSQPGIQRHLALDQLETPSDIVRKRKKTNLF